MKRVHSHTATKADVTRAAYFVAFHVKLSELHILRALGGSSQTSAKAAAVVAGLAKLDKGLDKALEHGTPPTAP